ncbi:MAG TPA: hypothetical protein VFS09_00205 [Candidatus Eisenbacteria bacterium]|nr:hypothetical protein [Candidatus Eisenbacteria bacterium]
MTRSRSAVRALLAVASLLLGIAAVGCNSTPTAPAGSGGGGTAPYDSPPLLQIEADGSASWVSLPVALRSGSPGTSYDDATFDPSRRLSASVTIDGTLGGRVVCGRYVATVPAGAFAGVGTITMTLPDSTLMLCDLEISPADLNGFLAPIDLALHTTKTSTDVDSVDFYWWDTEKGDWTSMGSQKSTTLDPVLTDELLGTDPIVGVRLDLNHFSRYMAGKAGW